MEKAFKYIVLTFIAVVMLFIIFALIWFSKSDLRGAVNNLNKADTTLQQLSKDLQSVKENLLEARKTIRAFDSTLTDIRTRVKELDNSRLKNQVLFEQLSRKLSVKVDEIMVELNKVSENLNEPVIHK